MKRFAHPETRSFADVQKDLRSAGLNDAANTGQVEKTEKQPWEIKASKVEMPGDVDEAVWNKAKAAIEKSTGKPEGSFGDSEWKQVQTVYDNMGGKRMSDEGPEGEPHATKPSAKTPQEMNDDPKQSLDQKIVDEMGWEAPQQSNASKFSKLSKKKF